MIGTSGDHSVLYWWPVGPLVDLDVPYILLRVIPDVQLSLFQTLGSFLIMHVKIFH